MYVVRNQLVLDGKVRGLRISNDAGDILDIKLEEVKELVKRKKIPELVLKGDTLRYKVTSKKLKDLPIVVLEHDMNMTDTSEWAHVPACMTLDGARIQGRLLDFDINIGVPREASRRIVDYLNSKNPGMMLQISGFDGVGKSTEVFRAFALKGDLSDVIYMQPKYVNTEAFTELMAFVEKMILNGKAVVIDNISGVKGVARQVDFFKRMLGMGGRIVLIGEFSYDSGYTGFSDLEKLTEVINLNMLTYADSVVHESMTATQYLNIGGAAGSKQILGCNTMQGIMKMIKLDGAVMDYFDREDNKKLKSTLFKILYDGCWTNESGWGTKGFIDLSDETRKTIEEQLGIDLNPLYSKGQQAIITTNLEREGVLLKVQNFEKHSDTRYYVTNPVVVNQLFNSVMRAIRYAGNSEEVEKYYEKTWGQIFKSLCTINAVEAALRCGYEAYYSYRADLVIMDKIPRKSGEKRYIAYKFVTDKDERLNWSDIPQSPDGCVAVGRVVVRYDESDTQERMSKVGELVIGHEEFLKNIDEIVKRMEKER